MSHEWPPGLLGLLNGRNLEDKVGVTPMLVTVDGDGWPHVALLSAGEVLLEQPDGARLALWPDSTTSANLVARRLGMLALAFDGTWWLARLQVDATGLLEDLQEPRLGVRGRMVHLRADTVPYATLTASLSFELQDPEGTVFRWRQTIASLREA